MPTWLSNTRITPLLLAVSVIANLALFGLFTSELTTNGELSSELKQERQQVEFKQLELEALQQEIRQSQITRDGLHQALERSRTTERQALTQLEEALSENPCFDEPLPDAPWLYEQ